MRLRMNSSHCRGEALVSKWVTSGPPGGHPSQSRASVKVRSHRPGPRHTQNLSEARLDRLKLAV